METNPAGNRVEEAAAVVMDREGLTLVDRKRIAMLGATTMTETRDREVAATLLRLLPSHPRRIPSSRRRKRRRSKRKRRHHNQRHLRQIFWILEAGRLLQPRLPPVAATTLTPSDLEWPTRQLAMIPSQPPQRPNQRTILAHLIRHRPLLRVVMILVTLEVQRLLHLLQRRPISLVALVVPHQHHKGNSMRLVHLSSNLT
mmetsp:Transcript_10875/g.26106  ORF Transcript_10875/g.26106 Transcript_10875/m.26106 type:complete len:200 (-) Transcript_10875:1010-1609(-)